MTNDKAIEIYGANVFAAAAASAFALSRAGAPKLHHAGVDRPQLAMPAMAEAAKFLRQWPDGSAEAVTIHLRMKGFPDVPVPGPRELAAWKVFAFTLEVLDDVDRQEEAAKPKPAAPAPVFPGERSFKPEPGPFDPVGLTPER